MVFSHSGLTTQIYRHIQKIDDPRISEHISLIKPSELTTASNSVVLLGYPDDQGVMANGGRTGAKDGPDQIRMAFGKLSFKKALKPLVDLGNAGFAGTLEQKQTSLKNFLAQLPKTLFPVSLGGGNDFAYPDVAACLQRLGGKKKLVVINLDAHLDVRTYALGASSGTPFRQLLEEFKNIELIQIGIQKEVNADAHFDYCRKKKVKVITMDEIGKVGKLLNSYLKSKPDCFLCVDIDGFSSAVAPGCSAPGPAGLLPSQFNEILKLITSKTKLRGLGIYEVNPLLDRDGQTAKLAAQIIHNVWSRL